MLAASGLTAAGDQPDEKPAPLLGRLQADIEANRPPTATTPDRSVQIHVTHGARRQVEITRDAILHVLAADPTRQPAAASELETYLALAPSGPHAAEAAAWLRRYRRDNP